MRRTRSPWCAWASPHVAGADFLPTETGLRGWAYRTRTRKCRFDPARFASVPSRRPRKVSDTKMLCKPKEFARDYKKPTFPSSSPTWPATQSGLCEPSPPRIRLTPYVVSSASLAAIERCYANVNLFLLGLSLWGLKCLHVTLRSKS